MPGGAGGISTGHAEDQSFVKAFLAVANALSLWILSVQVVMAVDLATIGVSTAGNLKSLSLSGLWALYAAVLIVLGIARRWRWLRMSGLGLLARSGCQAVCL